MCLRLVFLPVLFVTLQRWKEICLLSEMFILIVAIKLKNKNVCMKGVRCKFTERHQQAAGILRRRVAKPLLGVDRTGCGLISPVANLRVRIVSTSR